MKESGRRSKNLWQEMQTFFLLILDFQGFGLRREKNQKIGSQTLFFVPQIWPQTVYSWAEWADLYSYTLNICCRILGFLG